MLLGDTLACATPQKGESLCESSLRVYITKGGTSVLMFTIHCMFLMTGPDRLQNLLTKQEYSISANIF